MKAKFLYVLLIISIFFISKTYGEEANTEPGTYLNLSVTETTSVEPDLLIASLRFESESSSTKEVHNKINLAMKKALELSSANEKLNVSTQQYSVYKYNITDKQGINTKEVWKGSQTITIKGTSFEDILSTSGKLQEMGLVMGDLHYEVSNKKIEEVRASLVENAINKLLNQANKTSNIIGAKGIKVKNINIEGSNSYMQIRPKLMQGVSANMSEDFANPVSAPGKSDITLTISAIILLKD